MGDGVSISRRSVFPWMAGGVGFLLLSGCVGAPTTRMGMVKQENGLMIGSAISNNLVTDASFYRNPSMKLRTRNTSGDSAFDMKGFRDQLAQGYADKGYPESEDDFGLLLDVNVVYSGQIQENMAQEYGLLGAAGGGVGGYRSQARAGTAVGVVAGATIGSIIGSFVTDDTYVIVSRNTLTVTTRANQTAKAGKSVVFNRSATPRERDEGDAPASILKTAEAQVAVFAGGRNTPQRNITGMVRERMVRIMADLI